MMSTVTDNDNSSDNTTGAQPVIATAKINPPRYDAVMAGVEKYTPEDKERVLWLYGYFSGYLRQNKSQLCYELGYKDEDWEQLRFVFTGRIAASIHQEVMDSIDALRRRLSKQRPLVHTIVADMIIEGLNYCRDNSAMVYVTGQTGRGKTYTAEWWTAENNHGRTKYIRVPSECNRRSLIQMIARSFGIAAAGTNSEIINNLGKAVTPRNVIIIDEAGHLLNKSGKPGGAIEVLRDIHDLYKCGIALIFTDVYLGEIRRGRNADYFEQFLGRLEWPVIIPNVPRKDEVRQILQSYFGEVDDETLEFALAATRDRDGKLRTLFKDLFRAEEIARENKRPLSPRDLKLAITWRKKAGVWPEDK